MTTVGSGGSGSTPSFFHQNERANALPNSAGDKKLRADLFDMLDIETVDKKSADFANQFLVAAATDDIVQDSEVAKTAKLPGRVAVKVGKPEVGKPGDPIDKPIFKYAFLNTSSVAKRLHVSEKDVKDAERAGTLNDFIRDRIGELVKEQNTISEMLEDIAKGNVRGFAPERPSQAPPHFVGVGEEDLEPPEDGTRRVEMEIIPEAPPPQPMRPREKSEMQKNKEYLSNFIKANFSNDKYLIKNLDNFLNQTGDKNVTKPYLEKLVGKMWWNSSLFDSIGVNPEKIAISNLNEELLTSIDVTLFSGRAASREGNKGEEVTMRMGMPGDRDNRYAVVIDNFVYTKEPIPNSSKEVPLRLAENVWVLANKNSLERLGLTSGEIKEGVKNHNLGEIVKERKELIRVKSNDISKLNNKITKSERVTDKDIDKIREYLNHPDEEVRDITEKFLKNYEAWTDKNPNISKNAREKQSVGLVEKFIDDLEEAHLVLSSKGFGPIPPRDGVLLGKVAKSEDEFRLFDVEKTTDFEDDIKQRKFEIEERKETEGEKREKEHKDLTRGMEAFREKGVLEQIKERGQRPATHEGVGLGVGKKKKFRLEEATKEELVEGRKRGRRGSLSQRGPKKKVEKRTHSAERAGAGDLKKGGKLERTFAHKPGKKDVGEKEVGEKEVEDLDLDEILHIPSTEGTKEKEDTTYWIEPEDKTEEKT